MEVKIFGSTWGSELPLPETLVRIKEAGYHGVEMLVPEKEDERKLLKEQLADLNLELIALQILFGTHGQAQMEEIDQQFPVLLSMDPLFINSHSGKDHFDFDENYKILRHCEALSTKHQLPIYHETHRGRFAFSAKSTHHYLERMPELKLTADFSHWCCVSESLLEDQEHFLTKAIVHSKHIHARIGHAEGPQVSDPRAPEWERETTRHWKWWDEIVSQLKLQDGAPLTVTPEFGPPNYMPTLPFSRNPVADQWELNLFMKQEFLNRYGKN